MKLLTATQARTNLYKIIDELAISHEPVYVKSKRNDVVLITKEDYESMQETLYLQSIPGLVDSIKRASKEDLNECIELQDLDV